MTDDEIQQAWANEPAHGFTPSTSHGEPLLARNPSDLSSKIARAHRREQLYLAWLNFQEVVPAFGIAAVLIWIAPTVERPWALAAAAALSAAVGLYLLTSSARHHGADTSFGDSIRERVSRRLAQVEHRARLFRNIAWWYLLPLAAAFGLIIYGSGGSLIDEPQLLAGYGVFLGVVYVGNRWWGRWRYESEVTRLRTLLAEFD